ncbi:MAG: hypothetical protein SOY65_11020 [Marinifilaceae bacterium]|nr:hypothetical protein [Marinifilaceae bacterium]
MKFYYIILAAALLYACNNPEVNNSDYAIEKLGKPIGEQQEKIVQDLKTLFAVPEESRSNSAMMSSFSRQFATYIDDYQLQQFDYYDFDLERFYNDPSEENLQKCLIPREELFLVATKEGRAEYNVTVKKINNQDMWGIDRVIPNYQQTIGWLPDSLSKAETNKVKIFTLGSRDLVTYERKGEACYFKINGEPFTPAKLCEFLVEEYKQGKNMEQTLQKQVRAIKTQQ